MFFNNKISITQLIKVILSMSRKVSNNSHQTFTIETCPYFDSTEIISKLGSFSINLYLEKKYYDGCENKPISMPDYFVIANFCRSFMKIMKIYF